MSELAAVHWVHVKDSCLRESYGSLKYPELAVGWVARVRPYRADLQRLRARIPFVQQCAAHRVLPPVPIFNIICSSWVVVQPSAYHASQYMSTVIQRNLALLRWPVTS